MIAIIGTAGDRNDASLVEIGRLATLDSDYVIAKNTSKYLRGRSPDDLMDHYLRGIRSGRDVPYEISDNELTAVMRALEMANPGDVIAVMAHEYVGEIGALVHAGDQRINETRVERVRYPQVKAPARLLSSSQV